MMDLNIIDSMVYQHVAWLEVKEESEIINFLKETLKIIETVGLAISLVGILLIQKAVKAKKMYHSESWLGVKSTSYEKHYTSNSTHRFLLTSFFGGMKIYRKKKGLHPWKESAVLPKSFTENFYKKLHLFCNDKELWLTNIYSNEWYTSACSKKIILKKENEEVFEFLQYHSILIAKAINKVIVQDQEHREKLIIPSELSLPHYLEIDEKKKRLMLKNNVKEVVLKEFSS